MTCKDCLYYEACNGWQLELYNLPIEQNRNADKCRFNKNKTDFVEVVRCKDCDIPHNKWTGCPKMNGLIPPPNHFCSYGERKKS